MAVSSGEGRSILITTTTSWPSVALLALRFEKVGFDVTLLCPRTHPAWATHLRCRGLNGGVPFAALTDAIEASKPFLVVPTDDRAVAHLHALHATAPDRIAHILDRSLGQAWTHPITTSRVALLALAREVGLPTPDDAALACRADLDAWLARTPGPWVLKADGTWGGLGVHVARTVEGARRAFGDLDRKVPVTTALAKWALKRDPFWMLDRRMGSRPALCAQSFIRGRPGNAALFCKDGEVLGATVAEAEASSYATGPSTFIRVVERPDFLRKARDLVRRLGLSGFCGLDFMVDDATGEAVLIEMNPRITALSGVRHGSSVDPIRAAAALAGHPQTEPEARSRTLYAHFPIAWLAHPGDRRLALCHDDVPWEHPKLIAAVLDRRSGPRRVVDDVVAAFARRRQGAPVHAWSHAADRTARDRTGDDAPPRAGLPPSCFVRPPDASQPGRHRRADAEVHPEGAA